MRNQEKQRNQTRFITPPFVLGAINLGPAPDRLEEGERNVLFGGGKKKKNYLKVLVVQTRDETCTRRWHKGLIVGTATIFLNS